MRSFLRLELVLAMVTLWAVGTAEAQGGLTKQNRQGPVTVAVTLTAPPEAGSPVRAKVVLDTHSVALEGIAFDKAVVLRTPDGSDVAPTAVEATGGGHHREAVLTFPLPASGGPLRIIVKDVGGVAERDFLWELPLKP